MKVVIPMAGRGTRMRPHTLTVPKPLIPIAGKPIVQRLVEEIAKVTGEAIDEIAFIIGDFGVDVELQLASIAHQLGAKASFFYQQEALGTAHAIYCAESVLDGKVIVAFADTLFKADFTIDPDSDGSVWVNRIPDPSNFGVVTVDSDGFIGDFVEKPKIFVSDLAIIGIYYFKEASILRTQIQRLLDNNIVVNGEYQLTDALKNMQVEGLKFVPGQVEEWMDCGNKDATVFTNQRILEYHRDEQLIDTSAQLVNSVIIEPVYIGPGVRIENSVVGPHLSVGAHCQITNSIVSNSIIQTNTVICNTNFTNSMLGNFVSYIKENQVVNVGDYTYIG
jgi:glucose-1-phosphate thymidylyltransferase